MGRYDTMRSREYSGALKRKYHPCRQCTLFAGSCHCVAKHAMEKGPPTATCRKWHVGHGLVPRIAKQRNASECQRHVMRWEHHDYVWYVRRGKKKFFSVGHPRKKHIPPGIKPPPPPARGPLGHCWFP